MDFTYILENYHQFIDAFWLTLRIGALGIFLSFLLGLFCSVFRAVPVLGLLIRAYIELSRNTPLLIQIIFLCYALPKAGIYLSAEVCGVLGLAFLGGGYMCEAFRSGLNSVEKIQRESALSLGLSNTQAFFYVILPQALSVSVPAFLANVVFLLKETSVFSAIALADLMYVAKDQIGIDYMINESLFMLVVAYLLLLAPILALGFYLEKRLRFAGYGN